MSMLWSGVNRFVRTSPLAIPLQLRSASVLLSVPGDDIVETEVDEATRISTITLKRPPVNSLSLEMCQAISAAIKTIEKEHGGIQSLVLKSASPSILSAGLDLSELYRPDPSRLPKFWGSFQQLCLDLYGSRLASIAAIEGHAPAAGCMLALCCDFRIMAGSQGEKGGTIGLNETKLGITAPSWMAELMVRTVGFRRAEVALQLGELYSPEEALALGLVDEVCPRDKVLKSAYAHASKWAEIPSQARIASKQLSRQSFLTDLKQKREDDIEIFCSFVGAEPVQRQIGTYLEGLKQRR